MSHLVTIFGGSGFVGRYIAQRMAQAGWRVRVACRRPNEAIFVRNYGVVGQVEPILANIRDDESVRLACRGADAVVNCVGILAERGKNKFYLVQKHGAARVARMAAEEGAEHLVQISAIGADPDSRSTYAESKGEGEALVTGHFPGAVILRPSIVFGAEDKFFNRFAGMARMAPLLPVVGPHTRFQPVYVDDVAQAAALAAQGKAAPGIYELGGPDIHTFRELMEQMLEVIQRKRLIVTVPFWAATAMGTALDLLQAMSLGLFHNSLLTRDQAIQLRRDNVADPDRPGFAELRIEPTAMEAVLGEYLWRFRPSGQYSDIKASAKNLRS